jgi:CheY-like chemotaxis protein
MERKRILIAAKVPQQVQELRAALVSNGYEVKMANDGISALNLCRDFLPHLMLAEIELPKIDGHHLFREIKAQSSTHDIPFILLSQHRSVEERVHSINMGVDDYINIPFDVNELLLRFEIILKEIDRFESTATGTAKGFAGKLSDMNVLEALQAMQIAKKSGIVRVQHESREGIIFVKGGEVVDANLDQLDAPSAVFRMITWVDGSFRVEIRSVDQPRAILNPTQELIQNGMIFKDRWEQITRALPPLQAPIKPGENVGRQNFSADEKEVLSKITAESRLIDLVERSRFNDLKALQVVAGLFVRGALVERPAEETQENGKHASTNGNSLSDPEHLSNLVTSFLEEKKGAAKNGHSDRRHNDRRRVERRTRSRRWEDMVAQKNRIYLNKSELLMIREKLSEKKLNGGDTQLGMLF